MSSYAALEGIERLATCVMDAGRLEEAADIVLRMLRLLESNLASLPKLVVYRSLEPARRTASRVLGINQYATAESILRRLTLIDQQLDPDHENIPLGREML